MGGGTKPTKRRGQRRRRRKSQSRVQFTEVIKHVSACTTVGVPLCETIGGFRLSGDTHASVITDNSRRPIQSSQPRGLEVSSCCRFFVPSPIEFSGEMLPLLRTRNFHRKTFMQITHGWDSCGFSLFTTRSAPEEFYPQYCYKETRSAKRSKGKRMRVSRY